MKRRSGRLSAKRSHERLENLSDIFYYLQFPPYCFCLFRFGLLIFGIIVKNGQITTKIIKIHILKQKYP